MPIHYTIVMLSALAGAAYAYANRDRDKDVFGEVMPGAVVGFFVRCAPFAMIALFSPPY